jgi:hypothetical protein
MIAIAVTLLGILITNQAKVSEFRQLWINALREDAATLISHTFHVHAAHAGQDLDDSYLQLHQTSARIQLRLNPKEKKTRRIILATNSMREANHMPTEPGFSDVANRVNEFSAAVQDVLRSEWKRVKWGEPLYRTVFVSVAVVTFLWAAVLLYRSFPLVIHSIRGLK